MFELEKASAKIDRFGWDRMDQGIKDGLLSDWCDTLSPYPLPKIKAGIKSLFEKSKGNIRSINEDQVKAEILEIDRKERASLPKAPPPPEKPKGPRKDMSDIVASAFPDALTAQQIADREGK